MQDLHEEGWRAGYRGRSFGQLCRFEDRQGRQHNRWNRGLEVLSVATRAGQSICLTSRFVPNDKCDRRGLLNRCIKS